MQFQTLHEFRALWVCTYKLQSCATVIYMMYIKQGCFYLIGSACPFFYPRNSGFCLVHPWFLDWVLISRRSSIMSNLQSTCTRWCREPVIKLLTLSFSSDSLLLDCYQCFSWYPKLPSSSSWISFEVWITNYAVCCSSFHLNWLLTQYVAHMSHSWFWSLGQDWPYFLISNIASF